MHDETRTTPPHADEPEQWAIVERATVAGGSRVLLLVVEEDTASHLVRAMRARGRLADVVAIADLSRDAALATTL